MTFLKKRKIQNVINAMWKNPNGSELREKLFPNGKPEPEEFIKIVAELAKERSL